MSWLEGLAEPDWRAFHSDSEVQNIAKSALALLKEDCHNCKLECLLQKYDKLKEKYDALLKEQDAEIRQLRLALDIAKGTCKGIKSGDCQFVDMPTMKSAT